MPRASLRQRKDGRFKCKYKGIQFMGATQSEAYAKRDAYKKQLDVGLRAEAVGTLLSEYAVLWTKTYKHGVSDNAYNSYVRILNSFTKTVGDKPLHDVMPMDVQRAYNEQSGYSKSHISKYVQAVTAMFTAAVADRIISFNPCLSAKAPNGASGTHRVITTFERQLILNSIERNRFAPAVMVMLYAGLRRGEVLALNVDRDIDFQAMTITIREAVRFDGNTAVLTDPKTEAGKRTVPMLDILAKVLHGRHGLIAPAASGELMSEIAFKRAWESYIGYLETSLNGDTKRWYGRRENQGETWLKNNPWKPVTIRPHDLRHSYCTMLYDTGIDLKTAQKWMGHADQAMTLRIYTHLTAEREAEAEVKLRQSVNDKIAYGVQFGVQPLRGVN